MNRGLFFDSRYVYGRRGGEFLSKCMETKQLWMAWYAMEPRPIDDKVTLIYVQMRWKRMELDSILLSFSKDNTENLPFRLSTWTNCVQSMILCFFALHGESKELSYTFVHNFDKRWQIFKLLLLLYSPKICNKTHAALPSTPDYVAALSCVCSKKSDAKIQITITTAYQFKNSCCSETLRRILLKFAIFTSERWQLKLLRGYLILIRYAVVTVIWILASRFWNTVYTDSLRTDHGVFSLD